METKRRNVEKTENNFVILKHFLYPLNPTQGHGGLELIPAAIGQEAYRTFKKTKTF